MKKYALKVSNLSKTYKIYDKPSDRLMEFLTKKKRHTYFTSLNDISLELEAGQSLGVIGKNGAGKSTFLKLLARTLSPTTGVIESSGKIAALLELGAGFNPEFSGRQNILLNATLLGLTEREIAEKEQAIIQFAELEDYIDRPVKTYSSGMYVRLGFAIATAVRPDILIIDEALSVGDASFQKKCIERIMDFKKNGVSIIFCSHNLHQLQEICDRGIWIHEGSAQIISDSNSVVGTYINNLERQSKSEVASIENSSDTETDLSRALSTDSTVALIKRVEITDGAYQKTHSLKPLTNLKISVEVTNCKTKPLGLHLGVIIKKEDGSTISTVSTKLSGLQPITCIESTVIELDIPKVPLNFGTYPMTILLGDETGLVIYHQLSGGSLIINSGRAEYGPVVIDSTWSAKEVSDGRDV